jgi:hypothetical protein
MSNIHGGVNTKNQRIIHGRQSSSKLPEASRRVMQPQPVTWPSWEGEQRLEHGCRRPKGGECTRRSTRRRLEPQHCDPH